MLRGLVPWGGLTILHRSATPAYEPAVEQQKRAFPPNHLVSKNSRATNPLIPANVGL
jgi:hypothetical protein